MKENFKTNFIVAIVAILATAISGVIIAKTGALAFGIIPILLAVAITGFYILRNPFFGFLLIIFFLPFERVPTYEVGGVDIKINVILGFVAIVCWVIALAFNGKKFKISPNFLAIPLSLFVIALLLSLTKAGNMSRAVQVLVSTLFTIGLSIFTVNMIENISTWKKTVLVLFLSSLVVCLFGFFQFGGDTIGLPQSITLLKEGYDSEVFGFPRVQAFSMEPLYLANLLLIPISLAAAYIFLKVDLIKFKRRFLNRWWLGILLLMLLVIFVLTVSRGGYLGLIVSFIILAFFLYRQMFTWKNVLIALITIAIVISGVFFALSKGEYRATGEFLGHVQLEDFNKGESVQGRLHTFALALQAYSWSPLVGIGAGNFGPYVKNYPAETPNTGWPITNNQFIELLAETGLVGIVSYGLILLFLIVRTFIALKYAKDIFIRASLIGLLAAFVGVMVQYNFFSTLYIIHIWILIGMMVGVQNLALKKQDSNDKIRMTNDK